ncbi:hypothetical protein [Actinomadura sp. HBU206391]|uniref:hypothetical protein n=1 Tax=Actinomadura sp. HBU206391 TaxID=2731692 RepID=UPI0016506984|nr:hypothetical protein [Actinomadura sp. HBU206391]MBC6456578.1 hypothetical protein [Actinomadura sp. HBU206391]
MTASDDLLRRIEAEPDLAGLLAWPGDFDIARRDPIEELRIPSGLPLTPIAGDGAGGTYFLCGAPGGPRPVLYTDSEGGATLFASDLVEAVTLIAAYPYWQELGRGHSVEELEKEITDDDPDFPADRAALLALLDVVPPTAEEALARLRSSAARTVPDFQPIARHEEGDSVYETSYTPLL